MSFKQFSSRYELEFAIHSNHQPEWRYQSRRWVTDRARDLTNEMQSFQLTITY